jgi:hypothetical protein
MKLAERRLYPTCACGRVAPVGKRKCARCLKRPRKVVTLRAGNRGRNKVGVAAHKPAKAYTRKAKRQNPPQGGPKPVTAYRWRHV